MNGGSSRPTDTGPRGQTDASIGDGVVEAASGLLDADVCEWLVEADDRLVVRATSAARPADADRSYPRWTGIPGQSYTTGRACVIDDCLDVRSTASAGTDPSSPEPPYRSICCAPVDDRGLLVWKALEPGAFTEADRDRAERLAGFVRAALDGTATAAPPVADGGCPGDRDPADLLEEVADILSHDLKNPLNVAKGNLELARESADDRYVEQAALALDRIEALVDELVVLARTGHLVEQLETVDLAAQARTAWDHVPTGEATLEIEQPVAFRASDRGVCHLLENLIENAVAHAGEAVTVRVGGLEDGFSVDDDGPGIPPAHRDRVFDRGYSAGSDTSGLGLHIVERIAEAHGWSIDVGDSPMGGARFEITGVDIRTD